MNFQPRLLRETAEIALTEIKRFIEPRLREDFSLRRVSAPLFLPVGSPLLKKSAPGARVRLTAAKEEVEVVGSLDVWLRDQLKLYDIAPGFGVFAIMNALRPDMPYNSTSSPHVVSWAWQQAVEQKDCNAGCMEQMAQKVYGLLLETEKMVLSLFPHLHATLAKEMKMMSEKGMKKLYPDYTFEQQVYEYLKSAAKGGEGEGKVASLFVTKTDGDGCQVGELWVWNRIIGRQVMLADFAVWPADTVAACSLGGNIFRSFLALQILHQNRIE